jgi:hypothetical protein
LEGIQTAVAVGEELDDKLPRHEYYEYFGPDFTLHVTPSNMANQNSKRNLNNLRSKILENLSKLQHVPSIPFTERPPDTELHEMEDEELDIRDKGHTWDGEFSDSDSDSEGFEHHANHRALASSEPAFPRLSLLLYFSWPSSIHVSLSVENQKLLYKVSLKCIALLGLFIAGDFHSWLQ